MLNLHTVNETLDSLIHTLSTEAQREAELKAVVSMLLSCKDLIDAYSDKLVTTPFKGGRGVRADRYDDFERRGSGFDSPSAIYGKQREKRREAELESEYSRVEQDIDARYGKQERDSRGRFASIRAVTRGINILSKQETYQELDVVVESLRWLLYHLNPRKRRESNTVGSTIGIGKGGRIGYLSEEIITAVMAAPIELNLPKKFFDALEDAADNVDEMEAKFDNFDAMDNEAFRNIVIEKLVVPVALAQQIYLLAPKASTNGA